jgi:hypothetical protein
VSSDEMSREEIEQRCLDEAKRFLGHPTAESLYRKRIASIELEGRFPNTRIVVAGEYAYGGEWTVRFPVWDENHAISPRDDVRPSYRRFLSYLDIDLRER